ncbi:MAG: tetratricopeptide repeat protein, partial [Terriglobus roseus]|nr:tetratricopeptide repeat protein [Terriglobus roseus]
MLMYGALLHAQDTPLRPAHGEDLACQRLYDSGRYGEAATCFAGIAASETSQPAAAAVALLMEARSWLRTGDLERAEPLLRASLQAQPQSPEALYLLGHLLQERNRAKESLEVYTRAAALRPPAGEELRIVALDYVLLGSYQDALHWLKRATAFSPNDSEAWYDLGRVQMHEGRFADAAAALQKSLALQPRSAKAEDNLGVCLEAQNQSDAAIAAYSRAVAVAQTEPHPSEQPFVDYGKLLNTRNGFQQAVPLLKRATELNPRNSSAFAELSRAYSGIGAKPDALIAMERAVALDSNNSRLHFQLGRLYRTAGLTQQAQREFDLSSRLYGQ